jgi:hypothetical protein
MRPDDCPYRHHGSNWLLCPGNVSETWTAGLGSDKDGRLVPVSIISSAPDKGPL